jgi:hypothetical protein
MDKNIAINYKNVLEINTTPSGAATWARLGEGLTNLAQSLNEVLVQVSYLIDEGWGSTTVTGGQLTLALTGHRAMADAAQNYIFSDAVMYNFGSARSTQVRLTRPNGVVILWNVTIANATEADGDANQPGAITINLHGNGKPTIITDALMGSLIVVSVAGASVAGQTAIYVNPAPEAGHSYKYQVLDSVVLPIYDQVLTTGWTAWNGSAEIVAATGKKIVLAEVVTADNKCKKIGAATVTAHA